MNLNKYAKFGAFFFPLWLLVSYAFFYERTYPHYNYGIERGLHITLTMILSFTLLLVTGIPSFLFLRKREIGIRAKTLILIILIGVASFLFPLVYSSFPNKMRLQEYIRDLESLGFKVEYVDHFAYGHWTPTWVDTYYNFTSTLKEYNATTIRVSAGVPYNFVFFFPKRIEMTCGIPYVAYYIIWIE
jgi:hypothetical protein